MKSECIVLNKERNVTLTTYIQDVGGEFANIPKRPAMLVIPGGGYQMCSDREADPVAMPYLSAGYQVFILRYSVKEHAKWPNPLSDYEQAMELIKSRAEEWNIYQDKIAIVGFSAGGHLAASAATMSKNRPNAAILGYAVTTDDIKMCENTAPDTVSAVDKNTCPCFVFSTRTDSVVPIENSLKFLKALTKHNIAYESHIYSYGPHGFSTGDSSILSPGAKISNRAPNWVKDSIEWLKEVLGDFGDGQMIKPHYKDKINDDFEDFLSVDCTMGLLMNNENAKAVIEPILNKMRAMSDRHEIQEERNSQVEDDFTSSLASRMTLRDILAFANTPKEVLEQFNQQLNKIPNE